MKLSAQRRLRHETTLSRLTKVEVIGYGDEILELSESGAQERRFDVGKGDGKLPGSGQRMPIRPWGCPTTNA